MQTTTDAIGRVLAGRYRLETVIGTGASAHVFAALDVALQRRVAIKVLHPALAAEAGFLRRFRAEAQAAAALNHPGIVAVYDWGEDDGSPFLVLQHLAGGSLRDLLDTGQRLTHAQAAEVGRQAASALAYAHARGVVHRDVKPANLLFDTEGRLAVADFGLARALSEAAWTEPAGAVLGTARYAAPEQATGSPVDGRSDVYSLALVLYEAVTGVVPFAGDTTIGTLMARVGAVLPGHDALGPLTDALRRAAAPEADGRFDAAGLAARLAALGHQLGPPDPLPLAAVPAAGRAAAEDHTEIGHALFPDAPRGRHPEGSDPLALATAVGVAEPEAGGRWRRRRRAAAEAAEPRAAGPADGGASPRRRWPWVAAAVVLVAAVAGGGVAAWRLQVFTPSHRLPAVTGMTARAADAALARHHDSVQVWRHRSSLTAEAGTIVRQVPAAGTSVKDGSRVRVVVSTGPPPEAVPELSGLSGCPAVTAALAAHHLHASCTQQSSTTVPSGQVMRWDPSRTAPEDSTVTVVLSSGPPMVPVPSLAGLTSCNAIDAALQQANLVASCNTQYVAGTTAGQVVSESPTGQAPQGSTVTVELSLGPPPVPVPNVKNLSVPAAINAIDSAGLVVGSIYGPGSGRVFTTVPPAGQSEPQGTVVNLYTQ